MAPVAKKHVARKVRLASLLAGSWKAYEKASALAYIAKDDGRNAGDQKVSRL